MAKKEGTVNTLLANARKHDRLALIEIGAGVACLAAGIIFLASGHSSEAGWLLFGAGASALAAALNFHRGYSVFDNIMASTIKSEN